MRLVMLECDNWSWLYIDGVKVSEGHEVTALDVLEAIDKAGPHTADSFSYEVLYLDDHMDDEEEVADYCWNANSLSDWPEEVQEAAR